MEQTTPEPAVDDPVPATVAAAVRFVALTLVLAAAVALAVAVALPWTALGDRIDPVTGLAVGLLGPVLTGLALGLAGRDRAAGNRALLALNLLAAGLAGALVTATLLRLDPQFGITRAGPLAVVAAGVLVAGWLLLTALGWGPVRPGPVALVVTALLLLAAALPVPAALAWYTEDRFVDRVGAPGLPEPGAAAPAGLGAERWRAETPGLGWVGAAGRYLVVAQPDGVRVLDALTGQGRWHYHRTDVAAGEVGLSGDGRTTVVLFRRGTGRLGVGLDTATGRVRWQRGYRGLVAGELLAAAGTLVAVGPGRHPVLTALDAGTGAIRWQRSVTADSTADCEVTAVAAADTAVALAQRCTEGSGRYDAVLGLSTVDGQRQWRWRPGYGTGLALGDELTIAPAGARFLVGYGQYPRLAEDGSAVRLRAPRAGVVLDARTGAVSGRHESPGRLAVVFGQLALYVGDRVTAVDLGSGGVRWRRPDTDLAGWTAVAAVITGGRAYLALRGAPPEGVGVGEGGPLRLVALDLGAGEMVRDRQYELWNTRCEPGGDGRPRCDRLLASLLPGPGVVVLVERSVRQAPAVRLAALG